MHETTNSYKHPEHFCNKNCPTTPLQPYITQIYILFSKFTIQLQEFTQVLINVMHIHF